MNSKSFLRYKAEIKKNGDYKIYLTLIISKTLDESQKIAAESQGKTESILEFA